MKCIFSILLTFLLLSACSVQSQHENPSNNLNDKYPFFDIHVQDFVVFDQDSNSINATPVDHIHSRMIDVSEKNMILEALDIVRFVINTPEFDNLMKLQTYYSASDSIGPNGVLQKGQPYPDKNRLLKIIQNRISSVIIRKEQIPLGVFAIGQLPTESSGEVFNAYTSDDSHHLNYETFFIGFNNRKQWYKSELFTNKGFLAGVVFHELLHNMGFSHTSPLDITKDTVYTLQSVLEYLYNDPEWIKKYQYEFDRYQPFYASIYSHFLSEPTIANKNVRGMIDVKHIDEEQLKSSLKSVHVFTTDLGRRIQCVYDKNIQSYIMKVI